MPARVLIIDHQLHRLEFLEAVLLKAGYAVAVTTSGADALAACASPAAVPDLILLDMQLPAGESLETYHALRRQPATRLLPLLLLTHAPAAYWERLAYAQHPPVVVSGQLRDHATVQERVAWMLQEAQRAQGASGGGGQAGSGELLGGKDADLAETVVAPVE